MRKVIFVFALLTATMEMATAQTSIGFHTRIGHTTNRSSLVGATASGPLGTFVADESASTGIDFVCQTTRVFNDHVSLLYGLGYSRKSLDLTIYSDAGIVYIPRLYYLNGVSFDYVHLPVGVQLQTAARAVQIVFQSGIAGNVLVGHPQYHPNMKRLSWDVFNNVGVSIKLTDSFSIVPLVFTNLAINDYSKNPIFERDYSYSPLQYGLQIGLSMNL